MAVTTSAPDPDEVNLVELTGRVSGNPVRRELPSGDELVTLRLVVARTGGGPVDTIDCACWSAGARRAAPGGRRLRGCRDRPVGRGIDWDP